MNQSLAERLGVWVLPALALAWGSGTMPAAAADDKTYQADSCHFHVGGKTIRPTAGGLSNYYYKEVSAECPIVRDNIINVNGTKHVYVRAMDGLKDGNPISCTLMAISLDGWQIEWDTNKVDGYWAGSLYLDIDKSYWGGYYTLFCQFPFESEFYGYRVSEHD